MNNWIKVLLLVGLTAWLGACTSPAVKGGGGEASVPTEEASPEADMTEGGAQPGGPGDESTPFVEGRQFQGDPLDDPDSPLSKRVVYFDFDSSSVDDEGRALIEAHAAYLAEHPDDKVTLEGHADERGSREYNVALGERRANAVRQLMTLLGVSPSQINTVSYGEERPAALGHDESAWRLNRRVELVYMGH